MTTVAYRDGVIASDSCWADEDFVDTLSSKIFRLRSGALLGCAGGADSRPVINLLQGAKSLRTLPSFEAIAACRCDVKALLILPRGRIIKINTTIVTPENWTTEDEPDIGMWEIEHKFSAIGNGAPFAIGAMEAGADARKAVRIACRRDKNSRLPVHTLALIKSK